MSGIGHKTFVVLILSAMLGLLSGCGGGGGGGASPVSASAVPVASFTSNGTDLTVALDGSGSAEQSGSISTYAWSFGDSTSGSGATTSHTYNSAGTYSVQLTVTDARGITANITHAVTVTAPNPAVAYESYVQAALGTLNLLENVARALPAISNAIAPALGGQPAFSSPSISVPVMPSGTITVTAYTPNDNDGVFDAHDSARVNLEEVQPSVDWPALTLAAADGDLVIGGPDSSGAPVGYTVTSAGPATPALSAAGTKSLTFSGGAWERLSQGTLRATDNLNGDPAIQNASFSQFDPVTGAFITQQFLGYDLTMDVADRNSLSGRLNMLAYNGGATFAVTTVTPLSFTTVSGELALRSGQFIIQTNDNQGKNYALRVSVDPDPAYVLIEIDSKGVGAYDSSGRVLQSSLQFTLK